MTHDDPSHRKPPRAEPLQPDRPGRGADKQTDGGGAAPPKGRQGGTAEGDRKRQEQSETAVENTREGYGGG